MFIGDTETGRRIVRQEPNLASGGRATETDLQEFLNRTGSSSENLVLQELLERAKSDREFLPLLPFSLELGDPFCRTATARPGLSSSGIAIFGSRSGASRRALRASEADEVGKRDPKNSRPLILLRRGSWLWRPLFPRSYGRSRS